MTGAGSWSPACAVVALAIAVGGCADAPPSDRAASTAAIRQSVTDFSRLAFNGDGQGACRFAARSSYEHVSGMAVPADKRSCAEFWTWLGPADPRIQALAANPRMASVTIRETTAVAHMMSGPDMPLVWRDGRWKVDLKPEY